MHSMNNSETKWLNIGERAQRPEGEKIECRALRQSNLDSVVRNMVIQSRSHRKWFSKFLTAVLFVRKLWTGMSEWWNLTLPCSLIGIRISLVFKESLSYLIENSLKYSSSLKFFDFKSKAIHRSETLLPLILKNHALMDCSTSYSSKVQTRREHVKEVQGEEKVLNKVWGFAIFEFMELHTVILIYL